MTLPDIGATTILSLSKSQTQRTAQVCIYSFQVLALDELRGQIHERAALATQAENPVTVVSEVC